jgi:hypothetical protein
MVATGGEASGFLTLNTEFEIAAFEIALPTAPKYTCPMRNPANEILEVSMMYAVPRCLHVIAEIGVADALGDDPRSAEDLAVSTGANAGALARAMRLVSAYGIFEPHHDRWAHTPSSRLLRADHPQSMRSFVRWIGAPIDWKSFELLSHSIRTGESAAEHVTPGGTWAYLEKHPELNRIFKDAMTGKAHGQIAGILVGYDFSPFKTIADIGGGMAICFRPSSTWLPKPQV